MYQKYPLILFFFFLLRKCFGTKFITFSWFPEQIKILHYTNTALNNTARIYCKKKNKTQVLLCRDRWGQEEVTAYQSLAITTLTSSPGPVVALPTVCNLNGLLWANLFANLWMQKQVVFSRCFIFSILQWWLLNRPSRANIVPASGKVD